MKLNRRNFLRSASVATAGAITLNSCAPTSSKQIVDYSTLDKVLAQPVLKKELFPEPFIIETLELLRFESNFLCRVRSTDGAVGISVGNNAQLQSVWPIFTVRLQPFFPGKDARDLEKLFDEAYVVYKMTIYADSNGSYDAREAIRVGKRIPLICETSNLESKNGIVTVSSGPGLGVEIDPGFIEKHKVLS